MSIVRPRLDSSVSRQQAAVIGTFGTDAKQFLLFGLLFFDSEVRRASLLLANIDVRANDLSNQGT